MFPKARQAFPTRLYLESRLLASSGEDKPILRDTTWSPACMLPQARQAFPARLCLESRLLTSSSEDRPFQHDSVWSPACLLSRARTSLSCTTLHGVPLACILGQGQTFPVRLYLESHLLPSSGADNPFLCDSAWSPTCLLPRMRIRLSCVTALRVPPASFLKRGQALSCVTLL